MTAASFPLVRRFPATQASVFRLGLFRFSIWLAFAGSAVAGPLSRVDFGPVSALGAFTIVLAALVFFLLAASASHFRRMDKSLRPLAGFACWYFLSFFWGPRSATAFQNALVMLVFIGFIFLSSWYGCVSSDLARRVARLLAISTAVAATLYAFSLLQEGPGARSIWGDRTFALFAMLGLAWCLTGWHYGRRSCLWGAIGITLLIALSLSRLAFGVASILFPLSQVVETSWRRHARMSLAILLSAGFLMFGLMAFAPLRQRFTEAGGLEDVLESDRSAQGFTSGRTAFWSVTLESALDSVWVGKGVGSSGDLIQEVFPGMGHPHSEYLRILHDCGLIGLVLFLASWISLMRGCWRRWKISQHVLRTKLALATFLTLASVAVLILTDNVIVYLFIMAPLGVLVGTTLGSPSGPSRMSRIACQSRP